jgi:hypothetical protein
MGRFVLRKKAERLPFTVTGRNADEARSRVPPHQPSIDVLAQPSLFGTARRCRAKHLSYLLPGGAALRLRGIARYSQYPASLKINDDYQNPHDAFPFWGAERPHYNSLACYRMPRFSA